MNGDHRNGEGSSLRVCTSKRGLLCGLAGAAMALMFLFLGFWRTLFVAALFAAGWYIGGVPQKAAHFKRFINKVFPPKGQQIVQPAPTQEDLRAIRSRLEEERQSDSNQDDAAD